MGPFGPILIQDNEFIDEHAHFNRERIPERVVHAKGAGAFGYFEVKHDISEYCAAKVFEVGKKTPIAARFSQVAANTGYPDTLRDTRGFALKFYTDDGIWDLVGNNTPIFFIRDPILFPSFIHTQKWNPVTHLLDYDAVWDFMSLRPESVHQFMYMFGDRGTPQSYRNMNGYGSNTFTLVNSEGKVVWCKFHYHSDQGVKNMDNSTAVTLAGTDPDYLKRDLYNEIALGHNPSWTFSIQVMSVEEARTVTFNPFDVTKVWPHADFPLIPVGKLCLNQNPSNYFEEVEQIAFNVANFVPGIEPSPDKILQGRLWAYGDASRYRLGVNYPQIPVNAPYREVTPRNYQRDGQGAILSQNGTPIYHPNSFHGPEVDLRAQKLQPKFPTSGLVFRYDSGDEDNFSQPGNFYRNVLDDGGRSRLVDNIANHLGNAADFIQERAVSVFTQVDVDFASKVQVALHFKKNSNL